jgi:hypothetical protein
MIFGIFLLVCIFILWKLFVSGWFYKIVLFIAGWIGLYVMCAAWLDCGQSTAVTVGTGHHAQSYSWAFIIPTIVCLLALATTRVKDD